MEVEMQQHWQQVEEMETVDGKEKGLQAKPTFPGEGDG